MLRSKAVEIRSYRNMLDETNLTEQSEQLESIEIVVWKFLKVSQLDQCI